jgi:hypothetical protein
MSSFLAPHWGAWEHCCWPEKPSSVRPVWLSPPLGTSWSCPLLPPRHCHGCGAFPALQRHLLYSSHQVPQVLFLGVPSVPLGVGELFWGTWAGVTIFLISSVIFLGIALTVCDVSSGCLSERWSRDFDRKGLTEWKNKARSLWRDGHVVHSCVRTRHTISSQVL